MFQPLRNRLWRMTLVFLPWVIMETLIFAKFFDKACSFPLAGSLCLTGFVTLWAARFFLGGIPIALEDIWESNILSTTKTSGSGVLPEYSIQISLERSYVNFIHDFENYLNHSMQYACGILFFTIFFLVPFYWIESDPKTMHSLYSNLYSGVLGFSYFFLGILAWRLWALSKTISGLSAKFTIVPKLGHPDNCGGLSPLGNLCLWSAFLVGIWGILLSAWVVVARMPQTKIDDVYVQIAYSMLIAVLIIALLCFFYPLWSVHIAMLAGQSEVRRHLWKIGADIHQIESDLLQQTDSLKFDEDENNLNRLDFLRARYKELDSYPVWPFDIIIIKKLALSQSVPILTLTGFSEQIVKIVEIGVNALNQIGPK